MQTNYLTGVAGVLVKQNKILLIKRKNQPQKGLWCIPCGKVEAGEDLEEALVREFLEETHLNIQVLKRVHHSNRAYHPNVHYTGYWYLVKEISGVLQADDDAEDAAFFSVDDLPALAFEEDEYVINSISANT